MDKLDLIGIAKAGLRDGKIDAHTILSGGKTMEEEAEALKSAFARLNMAGALQFELGNVDIPLGYPEVKCVDGKVIVSMNAHLVDLSDSAKRSLTVYLTGHI